MQVRVRRNLSARAGDRGLAPLADISPQAAQDEPSKEDSGDAEEAATTALTCGLPEVTLFLEMSVKPARVQLL